ncbi:UDP-N-acetylmuramoyl-L-alanine--D-glutamate ligase [Pelagibacteraceae bacterium]|jgi:UDP-N-acetylmuramoylalanine--D-glutamate ligase|nr:UDP-N-acetylmuramoyl-L-alanine--D-glutamate ligase [Pelagibacteraceae bacterium]
MLSISKLKELSFLIYGLGSSGKSVVNFFKKNNINNYEIWDDKQRQLLKKKRTKDLSKTLNNVDYIILSPGISLIKKKNLTRFRKKIITDIDLLYLTNRKFKSIVVTGTNGKSTTCNLIAHLLKKNKFKTLLGGNIGTPILDLKITKNAYVVIEASSFQLSHSKFIRPDYAFLLNITNDHLDWHGNMNNYMNSKLKIFIYQKKDQFALINNKLKKIFKKKNFISKLIIPNEKNYKNLKYKIKNNYLKLSINDENMSFAYTFSKLLKISEKNFITAINSFVGLSHRYEVFLKKQNIVFINDSKATSFEATKYALSNSKNVYWILGGLPKKNDKIYLDEIKKNIIKCYIVGKNTDFFKKKVQNKINFSITKNLKTSLIAIFKDIKLSNIKENTILLSPASASYDQFMNFEKRGDEFKKLSRLYARKFN